MQDREEDRARVVESRIDAGPRVVTLVGPHDVDSAPEVRRALARGLTDGQGLIVDLTPAHLVDSVVLGQIIAAHKQGRDGGTAVAIVAGERTPPVIRNLLRISGVDRTIGIFPALGDAVRELGDDHRGA
jgi:anti-anti-sigma regulatory factor